MAFPLLLLKSMTNKTVIRATPWFLGLLLVSNFGTNVTFAASKAASVVLVSKLTPKMMTEAPQNQVEAAEEKSAPGNGEDNNFFPLNKSPILQPSALQSTELPTPLLKANQDLYETQKEEILNDSLDKISSEFKIPARLKLRTAFWFDIYTKYGLAHHVIHHTRRPWIVYQVVDASSLLIFGKGPLWLRQETAEKLARKEKQQIKNNLMRLARRHSYENLSDEEQILFNKLKEIPGKRKAVFMEAANSIRTQLGQKEFFESGLRASGKYLPYMEEEFKKQKLPVELTRMPFVESSFNVNAESRVGASGIWQIMPLTGRAYMTVSPTIDERNSPIKATAVAGKLLKSYRNALGSWSLAITSYNNGIGNIRVAMKKAKSNDLSTIIERYHQGDFRFASSNFYTCFLAALYAEQYQDIMFENLEKEPAMDKVQVRLNQPMTLKKLMQRASIDMKLVKTYNMDLKRAEAGVTLPKGYKLLLPTEVAERLGATREVAVTLLGGGSEHL